MKKFVMKRAQAIWPYKVALVLCYVKCIRYHFLYDKNYLLSKISTFFVPGCNLNKEMKGLWLNLNLEKQLVLNFMVSEMAVGFQLKG